MFAVIEARSEEIEHVWVHDTKEAAVEHALDMALENGMFPEDDKKAADDLLGRLIYPGWYEDGEVRVSVVKVCR